MKCSNCGAPVPAGDLFCGECGTRVVPEKEPSLPSPPSPVSLPPAEKPKRGVPRGLLIGCGGLLALAVIAGCIWGAVTLFGDSEPTLTPTQIVQKPTKTPTPPPTLANTSTPTAMPEPTHTVTSTPFPTQSAPAFELVAFALDVTDDDEPIDPATIFPPGTTMVYAVFDFSGMEDGWTYDAYWYRDDQEELQKSWEWSLGEKGTGWINIFDDDGLTPGDYVLELYVGDLLLLEGAFTIQAEFAGTVSNVRFALSESDDDLPLGVGEVFPHGITEVYVFFDYKDFGDVTEIESTWLRNGETDTSGTLDWAVGESGTYRIRFHNDNPLAAGDYEWQLRVAGLDVASGSFRIEEPVPGWMAFTSPELGFWLLYPSGWETEKDTEGVYLISDSEDEVGVLVLAEELTTPSTAEAKALEMAESLKADYPDLEVIYSDTGLVDGQQATILGATFTDEDGIVMGLLIVQVNRDTWTYGLVGVSDAEVADRFGEIVGQIADSFHFLGGAEAFSTTLLFDDFGDPSSGWDEKSDSDRVQGYRDGMYFISVSATDWIVWDTPGYNFDDFVLQVDVLQTAGDAGNACGVLFRYVDGDNFYRFGVTGDGLFSLFKQEKDEWITLVDWRESAYLNPISEPNRLKVVCQGDLITLYANDQELTSVTDGSFTQGDVGLFASAYDVPEIEAVFDDLWVTEAP